MSTFTRMRRVSITRYNPETLTLQANIIANAGTISASSLLAADAFVTACKATNVWAKLLDCGLFIGNQLAAAEVKLVYPVGGQGTLTNHGFVGGDYNETGANGGIQGDGATKYFSLGTTGNQAGLGALAFYSRSAMPNDSLRIMLGAGTDNTGDDQIALLHNTHALVASWGATDVAGGQTSGLGLFTGTNSATDTKLFQDAASLADNQPGVAGANIADEFYLFAGNGGNAAYEFWSGQGSFYALCSALTAGDVANLYAAVQALQIALNRNV